ncbi:MAG TPA: TIGR03118 family protein [Terriglobales bacterium]|nr:TIGR03118 family protein [Terriglobales bacterium]
MVSQDRSRRTLAFLTSLVVMVGLIPNPAAAQYAITKLVSNQTGKAKHQDTDLVNAWGISFFAGNPFWVSDAGTGKSTLYDNHGVKQGLVVTIPPASGTGLGSPTGQVANGTTDFKVSGNPALFIFATFDGTISGWNAGSSAVIAVTAPSGTSYTGLAIGKSKSANFLFAADNANNKVDIYDGTFKLVGSFTDKKLGLAAYGIQNINGRLFVTFSNFVGPGAVDIFDTTGKLIKTLTKSPHLNGPWGLALAPNNFGPASNALLVGNLGDGRINAFNAKTGKFMGPLKDTTNKVIRIDGLWGLTFGGGGVSGKPNQLFFAAGPNGYANGLFGVINFK